MPLVAHNKLPTFQRLRDRGQDVLSVDRARHQDIRELHIGLLNMMPDARLQACVDNTWGDTGKAIVNNWLGLVYQLTNLDRRKQFMHGVNPEDPLGLKV